MTSTSSSSSFHPGDVQRFEIVIHPPRSAGRTDRETEEKLTQRLHELLPGELFPNEVCFRGRASCFLVYSSQSNADQALGVFRSISFDSTSPIERALRGARPCGGNAIDEVNLYVLCGPYREGSGREHLGGGLLRPVIKRLLGNDNLLLPMRVVAADGSGARLQFHSRPALERALHIFRSDIPAGATDLAEQVLRGLDYESAPAAQKAAAGAGHDGGGAAPSAAASATAQQRPGLIRCALCRLDLAGGEFSRKQLKRRHSAPHCLRCSQRPDHEQRRVAERQQQQRGEEQQRPRMFRCELCRDELDEREFPSSEIAQHAQAPRCKRCFARREEEKRREWEKQQRRSSDAAAAGGGAAAAAVSSTSVHPCLAQNAAGRCTLPSPCRFGMVRADRCLMWLAGLCGNSCDHDGLSHDLTVMEQQTMAALQQLQQQQQQQPPPQRQPLQQQQQQQQPHQQAHGHDQLAYVAPPPPPPRVPAPAYQHQFVCDADYQQQEQQQQPEYQQQQPQQERAGQRRERESCEDDGFAARRHGQL